jgi:hypothetical protein
MRKLLLALGFLALWASPSLAQVPCIGVGGVNSVPYNSVICGQEPAVNTYAAVGIGIVPASSATDIACINGAANIVIRVEQIRVSGTAGTQIIVPVAITKHVSLDTGGTPATGTALPVAYAIDSNDATPKATYNAWTANPTINDASPGIIDVANLVLAKTDGTNGSGQPFTLFDHQGQRYMEALTLRKATEQICVNLNATSPSSGLVNVTFRTTEAAQ